MHAKVMCSAPGLVRLKATHSPAFNMAAMHDMGGAPAAAARFLAPLPPPFWARACPAPRRASTPARRRAGHNGAGKTTAISILTGVLPPSAGDARVRGASILDALPAIRRSLGVCPQFDILWPDITVAEHLQLYAAIKGYAGRDAAAVAAEAAWDVGAARRRRL